MNSWPITAVERDTGLSKDTLHAWERRYGFPSPGRDTNGERAYTPEQVQRLRLVKRLLDAGHQPGEVLTMELPALVQLTRAVVPAATPQPWDDAALQAQLELVRTHQPQQLRLALSGLLAQLGVADFVTQVAGPLTTAVGDSWLRGQLQVWQEHLYTDVAHGVLRQAIAGLPEPAPDSRPRVLLATLPGEPHGLGLLMAQALLALQGCPCTSLGTLTPAWDIAQAAQALKADIVALSFTGCIGPDQAVAALAELRAKLPAAVLLWAGGSAPVLQRRHIAGVQVFDSFEPLIAELREWRQRNIVHPNSGSHP